MALCLRYYPIIYKELDYFKILFLFPVLFSYATPFLRAADAAAVGAEQKKRMPQSGRV